MKKNNILLIAGIIAGTFSLTAQNFGGFKKAVEQEVSKGKAPAGLSESEVGEGLKEALNKGIEKGVAQLSQKDGYFKDAEIKIPMPQEAQSAEQKLRDLGQGAKVDDAIESMNRAAEDAANEAKDLFVAAIKSMSVKDAMGILKGNQDAATRFLESATRSELEAKFKPIIKTSLDKVGATKHWNTVFSTYNKIPLVQEINPNLEEYVTGKALDGLFIQIAKEELSIRKNPAARVTDLLKKVFE